MQEYIRKLQSKDEDSRKIALIGFMALSIVVVGFVWYVSMQKRFTKVVIKQEQDKTQVSPFQMLKNSFSNTYQSVTASVGDIKNGKFKNDKIIEEKMLDVTIVDSQ